MWHLRGVRVVLLAMGLACGFGGCKRPAPAPAASAESTAAPVDPATLGAVTGTVRFAGKPPAPVKIDTSMDPACGLAGEPDLYSEQYAVTGDRLANVYVYVKSIRSADGKGLVTGSVSSGPGAVLDQKGCRYLPHVIAVQAGEPVEFRNEDPTMHNVHAIPVVAGNAALDISQGPKGKPQTRIFRQPESMIPVRCNNHPWMEAFVNVSATPWFAVTGADGKFSLKGMPPGEYILGAVQEKMGEQEIKVTVHARQDAVADVTFAIK